MAKKGSLGFMDGRAATRHPDPHGHREGRGASHDSVPADSPRSRPVGHRSSGNGAHISSAGGTRTVNKSPIKRYLAG